MALRISHVVYVSLWLSLLLLLFHQLYNSKSKPTITKQQTGIPNYNISSSSFSRQALVNRKVLSSKFDFTPFQKKSRQTHHGRGSPDQNVPPESEIDPATASRSALFPPDLTHCTTDYGSLTSTGTLNYKGAVQSSQQPCLLSLEGC